MKKLVRYATALALVLCLGVGMMAYAGTASAASKKSVTIHVKNTSGWKNLYIYTYDGDGELANPWPGSKMKANKKNKGWCDYTFKTSKALNLVFNEGKIGGEQTNDVKNIKNNKKEYWMTVSKGSSGKNAMHVATGCTAKLMKKAPSSYKK